MRYIVDIKGEIEGDYEIIGKYKETPHGKWSPETLDGFVICSECKCVDVYTYPFCPNCGADMRGEKNG